MISFPTREAIDSRQRVILPVVNNKDDPLLVFLPSAGVLSESDQKGWFNYYFIYCTMQCCVKL